jgi:hypothetical protein
MNETNFYTSKDTLSNEEIEIYLHNLAREFNSNKMRIVADRFAELHKIKKEQDYRATNDWK